MKRTWSELRETGLRQYKKLLMAAGFLSILPLPGSRRLFKANVVEASPLSGGNAPGNPGPPSR